MFNRKAVLVGSMFVVAGAVFVADTRIDPSMGYVPSFWEPRTNLLLVELLPPREAQNAGTDVAYRNVKVLADMRDKVKVGSVVQVKGFRQNPGRQFPFNDVDGAIQIWPVQQDKAGIYNYYNQGAEFPIGLTSNTRIAPSDVDKVTAALKELAAAVKDQKRPGPSRARAGELIKDKNYYLWALGVWRIAHDSNTQDVNLLKAMLETESTSPAQAYWLELVLNTAVEGADPNIRPSPQELERFLRDYITLYARRQPGGPGMVAPATAPALPLENPGK